MARPPLTLVRDDADADQTPFDALLGAAARDPEAASGLALAYADMTREAREKLVAVIRSDPNALVLLLGVEDDPELAGAIAVALRSSERAARWRGPGKRRDSAFSWGDASDGGIALVRHLHGQFVDALRVSWVAGVLDAEALPISSAQDDGELVRRAGVPADARRIPFERGVDILTEALWRARREGRDIPPEVRPFADVFRPPRV